MPVLRDLAALRPGDALILHDLGLACLESGQAAEAVRWLSAAIGADPFYADAHLRLGIACEAEGDLDTALSAYRAAWTLQPGLADARYRAGNLLETLGRMPEAADAFRAAAESAPHTTQGWIADARALLAASQDAAADSALRAALAAEPDNAAALELLGNVLADDGRFEEARAMLIRAVERDPRRAGAYYDIARCRRRDRACTSLWARRRPMRASSTMPCGISTPPRRCAAPCRASTLRPMRPGWIG